MKRLMLHPKKPMIRKEGREIRDPTTLHPLIMIIYLTLAPSLWYPLVTPPPYFDGTDYTKWSYSIRMHLISLSPSIWNIVRVGVDFSDKDEKPDFEQLQ
jgi:hypothetical protein